MKDTYSIPNNPLFSDDPCQGMYIWRGVTVKNVPAFGNFIVVGQNPDKIAMYNNAPGNYDKLEFVRV